MSSWKWHVRLHYNDTVKYPKTPGALAIEVGGLSEGSLSADIAVGKKRKDIGRITLIHPDGYEEVIVE